MVTWNNTTTEESNKYLVRVGQRLRYCQADYLLHSGKVNFPSSSQADDAIVDVSLENTDIATVQ